MTTISVIIPTFNDDARLQICVNALDKQSLPKEYYEVIIVNNSEVPTSVILPRLEFKVITEEKPGSYAARNLGISQAQGSILAFTDSDCIPQEDWLLEGIKAIQLRELDRLAGRIKVFSSSSKPTPVECYEKIFAFRQERGVSRGIAATANFFCKKHCFDEIGDFHSGLFSGGDVEWNTRATLHGLSIGYCGSSIVLHPARRRWKDISKKVKRTTGGEFSSNPRMKMSPIRSLLPPVAKLKVIVEDNETNFREKFLAFFVSYRIKLLRYCYFRQMRSGKKVAQRD